MKNKYNFHEVVKNALVKDGWNLKDENFQVSFGTGDVNDTETLMIFDKDQTEIAVISDTFLTASQMQDFHFFVGRYLSVRLLLQTKGFDFQLFSAVTASDFQSFYNKEILEKEQILLIIYDFEKQKIIRWSNRKRIPSVHLANKEDAKFFEKRVTIDLDIENESDLQK